MQTRARRAACTSRGAGTARPELLHLEFGVVEVHFDGHCFGCGPLNEDGLRMVFTPGTDGAFCDFEVPPRSQSWKGMAHGGIVSLMLDEAVGWAAWHAGHPGVTGRLAVSLRRPLRLGERVRVLGQVERVRRTLVYCI